MRVAIVAESFLPNVNGVSNSVLRVLEHLRRTGHEALVIAPDNPPGQPRADRIHDGIRVHRVPSRMFPRVTTLPLGVPMPRMVSVLRGFDPDVVHLASPALLGYGGVKAARWLGVPTVAVYQTDVPGFAASYGIPMTTRAAWAWFRHLHSLADRTLAPSSVTMESLVAHRFPRVHRWARGVDVLVTVGPLAAAIADRFDGEAHSVADAGEAASLVPELLQDGDVVLIKASRGVGLELVCDALREGAAR